MLLVFSFFLFLLFFFGSEYLIVLPEFCNFDRVTILVTLSSASELRVVTFSGQTLFVLTR